MNPMDSKEAMQDFAISWMAERQRNGERRCSVPEAFEEGYRRGREDKWAELDALIAQYPKDGKWDDALSVWAYKKGFEAALHIMTPEEREQQRQSFAYGNVKLHNDAVTRDMVAEESAKLKEKKDD